MAGSVGKMADGFLYDNQPYTCTIESSINIKSHTEYALRVTPQLAPKEECWVVSKRYSDFVSLCDSLKLNGLDLIPSLPPKKLFGRLDDDFIAERLKGLQVFLNLVQTSAWISHCIEFKLFLSTTVFSNLSFEEVALENATMLLRSELRWEIVQALPYIGWRVKKCYFWCRDKNNPKQKYILTWCGINQRTSLDPSVLEKAVKLLMSLQHPHVAPTVFATCNATCVVAIRPYYEHGSLRDAIHSVNKPASHYLRKYAASTSSSSSSLQPTDVCLFGRQILETVLALKAKGLPYVHIHAGNVAVLDGGIQLLDLENSFTGISSLQRLHYVKLRKLKTTEALEVFSFAHLLYEMVTGSRLSTPTCDISPRGCPADLWSLLESILSTDACKHGLPTMASLLQHRYFSGVAKSPLNDSALRCKVGSRLRESLRIYQESVVKSLQEDQRRFHQQQCLLKAQAFHMSAEEKEKRRLRKVKSLHETEQNEHNGSTDARRDDRGGSGSTVALERNGSLRNSSSSVSGTEISGGAVPSAPPPPPVFTPAGAQRQGGVIETPPLVDRGVAAAEPAGRSALLSSISSFNKGALKKRN